MPIQTHNKLPDTSAASEAADGKHALSPRRDVRLAAAEARGACTQRRNQDQRLRSLFSKAKEAIIWSLVDHANRALSDSEVQQLTTDLLAVNQWAGRFEDELLSVLFTSPSRAAEHQTECNTRSDEGEGLSLLDNETLERAWPKRSSLGISASTLSLSWRRSVSCARHREASLQAPL